MNKGCILTGILIVLMSISCSKTDRPETPGQRGTIQEMNIGVDVPLETAKKQLIGKWNLVRISKFYTEFKLSKPGTLIFNADGTFEFHINITTTANTGKLSYKGKWILEQNGKRLKILLNRTHKAFENDWVEAENKDGAVLRFLTSEYKTAIINITSLASYDPIISEDWNNYWEKAALASN